MNVNILISTFLPFVSGSYPHHSDTKSSEHDGETGIGGRRERKETGLNYKTKI